MAEGRAERSIDGPELVFGLVGPVGADLDRLATALHESFLRVGYTVVPIRLSRLLEDIPKFKERLSLTTEDERYETYMAAGTELREEMNRGDALALLAVLALREERQRITRDPDKSANRHVYLLRSLKHPAEVDCLRHIYGTNFYLVAAYTPRDERLQNLAARISESRHVFQSSDYLATAQQLLQRDEAEVGKELGQQVRRTFPLADVFIDTSDHDQLRRSVERLVDVLFGYPFHTPTKDEYGMFHAQAAALRSAAMGRQVGVAVTSAAGDIIAVGTNEVPKASGGLYWCDDRPDHRDFALGFDINDKLKRRLLADVLRRAQEAGWLTDDKRAKKVEELIQEIEQAPNSPMKGVQLMNIIEYGRCVHAEMAAIIDAARRGVAVADCTLYTTTFPCHECARHIVAAGIAKVVYIEPYPKSMVPELYPDSIALEKPNGDGCHVGFKPFVGVAPRKYLEFFQAPRRKEPDGSAVLWDKTRATPRFTEAAVAVMVREKAEVQSFKEQMEARKLLSEQVAPAAGHQRDGDKPMKTPNGSAVKR